MPIDGDTIVVRKWAVCKANDNGEFFVHKEDSGTIIGNIDELGNVTWVDDTTTIRVPWVPYYDLVLVRSEKNDVIYPMTEAKAIAKVLKRYKTSVDCVFKYSIQLDGQNRAVCITQPTTIKANAGQLLSVITNDVFVENNDKNQTMFGKTIVLGTSDQAQTNVINLVSDTASAPVRRTVFQLDDNIDKSNVRAIINQSLYVAYSSEYGFICREKAKEVVTKMIDELVLCGEDGIATLFEEANGNPALKSILTESITGGLFLKPEQAERIMSNKQDVIIRKRDFSGMCNKVLYACDRDKAYGLVLLT